jgi:hypothetical protein
MKSVYQISLTGNDQLTRINVLDDTLSDALTHAGNPTFGVP